MWLRSWVFRVLDDSSAADAFCVVGVTVGGEQEGFGGDSEAAGGEADAGADRDEVSI